MVRLVECDGSKELDEMKQHLYHGLGSCGALFFATYSGVQENSLTDHFLFVGVQHSVRKTAGQQDVARVGAVGD